MRQFALFCVSGGLAFVVDAGLTQAWVSLMGLDPWTARALSFPVAVTCTWLFNRNFTFRERRGLPLWREWLLYVGTQLGGLSVVDFSPQGGGIVKQRVGGAVRVGRVCLH